MADNSPLCATCGRPLVGIDRPQPGALPVCGACRASVADRQARDIAAAKLAAGDLRPLYDSAEASRKMLASIRAWVIFLGVLVIIGLILTACEMMRGPR
jgi:hypothetical protein